MFVTRPVDLQAAIQRIVEATPHTDTICAAVAFWGRGAEALLPPGRRYRVVCNLDTGGTNPEVIRKIVSQAGTEVRNLASLHAKVVVGKEHALIGSANFSANGLGLEGEHVQTWAEAGVLIEHPDERLGDIKNWFWDIWNMSEQVNETMLRTAARKWEQRAKFTLDLANVVDHAAAKRAQSYAMVESDLFKPEITGGNQIRMAAEWLETSFEKIEPEVNNTSIRVPAFVANLLWTYSGKTIATRIADTPVFALPSQVWDRAKEPKQPGYNEEKIMLLLRFIADDDATPSKVRYWARQYLSELANG